jgi:hypothetical protein
MPIWGLMAIVPPAIESTPRVTELSRVVRQTLVIVGMQGKSLADAMGLRPSHLSRQLEEQGLNLARLINAGVPFWVRFLKPLTELVGLTRDQVLDIFGAETDAERDTKDAERDRRIAELERQLADVLKRLPAPSKDSAERVA